MTTKKIPADTLVLWPEELQHLVRQILDAQLAGTISHAQVAELAPLLVAGDALENCGLWDSRPGTSIVGTAPAGRRTSPWAASSSYPRRDCRKPPLPEQPVLPGSRRP